MNFRIFEVKFLAIILLLAVLFTMPSCSKKAPSNGKTLTSEKGKQSKGPLGRIKSWFSKKGMRDEPGLVSGEIVATTRKGWSQPTPFGMVLVPGGSFIMGQADEDVTSSVANFNRRVTVVPFFMDDTEITNNEYRQFTTSLLRDSVSVLGEERIMAEYYPDTTVWKKDFSYHNGDPLTENYYSSPAFDMYPVVGVSWKAAKYFALWRTKILNDYRAKEGKYAMPSIQLPTESEWEWAAKGGKAAAKYPWGNPYLTNSKGCLLANFKPRRGNFDADGYAYTAPANAYTPNDYGLYNMAGNVAEWVQDSYAENSTVLNWDSNPVNLDAKEPRKVLKGGSWKDIAYYLETGPRVYEIENSKRSYIGFRCSMRYLGKAPVK